MAEVELEESRSRKAYSVGTIVAERYRVLSVIGEGGMGVVYKAEQVHMSRVVALKTLLNENADGSLGFRRFKQEAHAASLLNHPHIVAVHDFGFIGENQAYLVMDFLDGPSLSEVLHASDALPLERFRHIFMQACDGLQHAHEKGVVHRDVKPSNFVLIERDGNKDFLILVDFGLVKLMDPDKQQGITTTSAVVGSPLYMSPEQCRGLQLDHRSDIYSLGCVMYQALTGSMALMGETALDTMLNHLNVMPVPLKEVRPDLYIPPALERVILKCLAKDPDARPQSMSELSNAIKDALSGAPQYVAPLSVAGTVAPGERTIGEITSGRNTAARSESSGSSARHRQNSSDPAELETSRQRSRKSGKNQKTSGGRSEFWTRFGPWIGVVASVVLVALVAVTFMHLSKDDSTGSGRLGDAYPPDRASAPNTVPDSAGGGIHATAPVKVPVTASYGGAGNTRGTAGSFENSKTVAGGTAGKLPGTNTHGIDGVSVATTSASGSTGQPGPTRSPATQSSSSQSNEMNTNIAPIQSQPGAASSLLPSGESDEARLQSANNSYASGNFQKARADYAYWYDKTGIISPERTEVLARLVDCCNRLGDGDAARRYYEELKNNYSTINGGIREWRLIADIVHQLDAQDSFAESLMKDAIEKSKRAGAPADEIVRGYLQLNKIYAEQLRSNPNDSEKLALLLQNLNDGEQVSGASPAVANQLAIIKQQFTSRPPAGMAGGGPGGFPGPPPGFNGPPGGGPTGGGGGPMSGGPPFGQSR